MLPTLLSVLILLLVVLLFVAALLLFRATTFGRIPAPLADDPDSSKAQFAGAPLPEAQTIAEHLSAAIRLETISAPDERGRVERAAFESIHNLLTRMYPRLHAALKRERVNTFSLLYTWPGTAPELEPVVLCGHLDVVPSDPANLADWSHPPFSGDVAEGCVWGRGALDMKSTVITVLEAVENLLEIGYQPERTVYLALGHDEEVGGQQGARRIVELLTKRGVRLAAVLDEGGAIMQGMVPGVHLPVGLIGISEKGHASFELRVEGRAGHSSMPPRHTAIGVLARAITRVEANPMPARLYMARLMFTDLGAFLPFSLRLAFANDRLFGRLIRRRLSAAPSTNALIRTTFAATLVKGGVKDNILPALAQGVVNARLLPGDSVTETLDYLRRVINDEAVQIRLPDQAAWEASPLSPISGEPFASLSQAVRQVYPEAVVAPYLMAGATDSRYYTPLCSHVFRFSPYLLDADLLNTIHGPNERIPVDLLARMVAFYRAVILAWT